jgi:exonuclease SbcD
MKFKFLHLSDVHLGYQQYNHKERFNDFGRAFLHIVDQAVAEKVDFVILGGDLFQKRGIDPPTLLQAIEGLSRLKEAAIPVAAVEGNHEKSYYRDVFSWMDFLAEQNYLTLLNPVSFEEGVPLLTAWDGAEGAYLDLLDGVRVYGIKYYGASTGRVVEGLIEALAQMDHSHLEYVTLVMHAGLEGVLPSYSATLTHTQIAPLKNYVDYLALGHIHKPFEREDWIYNPGSPETCGMDEAAWTDRGYYLVEVDTAKSPKHSTRLIVNPRRPFVRLSFNVDGANDPDTLHASVEKLIRREAGKQASDSQPVVELMLEGVLTFDRRDLDARRLEVTLEEAFDPLLARVTNHTIPTEFEVGGDESKPRSELEREVVEDLVERDARYRPMAAAWADIILDIKRMVLEGTSPEVVVDYIRAARQRTEAD